MTKEYIFIDVEKLFGKKTDQDINLCATIYYTIISYSQESQMKRNASYSLHTPSKKFNQMSPINEPEPIIVESQSEVSGNENENELFGDLAAPNYQHFTPRPHSPSLFDENSEESSSFLCSLSNFSPHEEIPITVSEMKNERQTSSKRTPFRIVDSNRKGCNCKQSKCQKGYCDCLKIGLVCQPGFCSCENCQNTQQNDKHKQIQRKIELSESSNKGCKCKKSQCLKKYCECHSGGRRCGSHCECVGCLNADENSPPEGEQEMVKKLRRMRETVPTQVQ